MILKRLRLSKSRLFPLLLGLVINAVIGFLLIKSFDTLLYTSSQSIPLILLFTYNRSVKTRDNICRGVRNGGSTVNFDRCPRKCEFSCRIEDFRWRSPEAVLFFGEDFFWSFNLSDKNRTSFKQRWIFWSWEAPIHHAKYTKTGLTFNWTMTYRQDSDIVHSYGRSILRTQSNTIRDHQSIDFYLSPSDNKSTFQVENEFRIRKNRILWLVSNCNARLKRNKIARTLATHFPIDQYGKCSKSPIKGNADKLLFSYKFYLAFENAACRDYITEKAFYNALSHGSIPIVLGPSEENYKKILPPNSYIYIENFRNPTDLAKRLRYISKNFDEYLSYHRWRIDYRIITWPSNYFINDRFCDLCIKLHEDSTPKIYSNFSQWLNQCRK